MEYAGCICMCIHIHSYIELLSYHTYMHCSTHRAKSSKLSTVCIHMSHQKTFYHLGNVELFKSSSNKFLVHNLRERYETAKRVEIPEPPDLRQYFSTVLPELVLVSCATVPGTE